MPEGQDLGALIRAAQSGDEDGLAAFVDEHYGAMHRFARLVGRDPGGTQRAVRAAWLAALERPDSQPPGICVRAWLLQLVLQQLAIPEPPAEAEPVAPPEDFEDATGRWAGWWKDDLAPTTMPDARRLDGALATLPAALTATVVLRDVEQLSPEEVQLILGHPPALQLRLLQSARSAVRTAARRSAA